MKYVSKEELLRHTGRLSQLGGITSLTYAEGRARGTSALRVRTAAGLEFWVVPDRGMDLYEASFKGMSLCWHSPTGMVHPSFYSKQGLQWLDVFSAGLLTTCGLTYAGAPTTDGKEELGLHGPYTAIPAEQVGYSERWEGDDCIFEMRGDVRETSVHGANMLLQRTISSSLRSTALAIEDVVTNQGVRSTPLMLIYHLNFGFPLLTERSCIYAPSRSAEPIDDWSKESVESWSTFGPAVRNQRERVYFHEMAAHKDGNVQIVLVQNNEDLQLAVRLSYDASTLPQFVQWKITGENHFVLGLEPSNCRTLGRSAERKRGTLQMLEPGESRRFRLQVEVLEGAESIREAIGSI